MATTKPKLLKLRRLMELSIVDRPANPEAQAVLMKRADGPVAEQREATVPNDDIKQAQDALAKAQADLADATKRIAALETDLKVAESANSELTAKAEKAEKALEAEINKHRDPQEVLLEKLDPIARKALEDAQAQAKAAQELLKSMQQERDLAEVTKSIARDYPFLPQKADALAPILIACKSALKEPEMAVLTETLKAASAAFEEAQKAQGLSGGVSLQTSAEAEIDKMARERAAQKGLTYEQAYSAVVQENPSLYAKFDAERHTKLQ